MATPDDMPRSRPSERGLRPGGLGRCHQPGLGSGDRAAAAELEHELRGRGPAPEPARTGVRRSRSGEPGDPVAPLIGAERRRTTNSETLSLISSEKSRFSWLKIPFFVMSSLWTTNTRSGLGFGTTSVAQVSAPTRASCLATHQRATSNPIPGSPSLNLALSFIQRSPHPVLKNTPSPGWMLDLGNALPLQRRLDVGDADLLAHVQHAPLEPRDVDHDAAREERLALLDAELLRARRRWPSPPR